MMRLLNNMKVRNQLLLLSGIMLAGFLVFGTMAFRVINTIKVNGPIYANIVQGKDLLADILPPPEYILESYLTVLQAGESASPDAAKALLDKFRQLRKDFDTRQTFWQKNLPEGPMKEVLTEKTYRPALSFYEMAEKEFFPAILGGDEARARAARDELSKDYESHRQAIDELVRLANEYAGAAESSATRLIARQTFVLLAILCATIIVAVFVSFQVIGLLLRKLGGEPALVAEIAGKVAVGDVSMTIDTKDKDASSIIVAMSRMVDSIKALVADTNMLSRAAIEGKLAIRADATKHQGDFQKIVAGVNNTLDAVIGPLNVAAEYVDRIAKGDIPPRITDAYNGDFNEIKNNLNQCIDSLNSMVAQMGDMYRQQKAGDIEAYIDAEKFSGAYSTMMAGVNDAVQLHVNNIMKILNILTAYAEGDFAKVLEKLPGKQAVANDKMDLLRNNLLNLIAELKGLSRAAVDGKLATRADDSKYKGDWAQVVQGVNDTLEAVIGPLNVAAGYIERISKGDMPKVITDTYNGDFNGIKNNLNVLIEATNSITANAKQVAQGNLTVKLNKRSDNDELMESLSAMVAKLKEVVMDVQTAAENVAAGGQELSATAQHMSQGATEQAASAEEVSSSMEQMAANGCANLKLTSKTGLC